MYSYIDFGTTHILLISKGVLPIIVEVANAILLDTSLFILISLPSKFLSLSADITSYSFSLIPFSLTL